jgi:uncharacterized protein YcbX
MRITGLNIYPIKGCRGTTLQEMVVDRIGPIGDRRLMLVDASGRFISQRENTALATLEPTLVGGELHVHGPGREPLRVDIDPLGEPRDVRVWGHDAIVAADQGDAAADWFSDAIGAPCRLVHFGDRSHHRVDPAYSTVTDAETSFTDGYPILAVLQESFDDLNARLPHPIPVDRFRPSVVVAGAPAWSEDEWKHINLGSLRCDAVKPCARCLVTTTDQRSGDRDPHQEPLRTLAAFRVVPRLGAIFGQNLVHHGTGVLRVGDSASPT